MSVVTNPNPNLTGTPLVNGVPIASTQDMNNLRAFFNSIMATKVQELLFNAGMDATLCVVAPHAAAMKLTHKEMSIATLLTSNSNVLGTGLPNYLGGAAAQLADIQDYGFSQTAFVIRDGWFDHANGFYCQEFGFTLTCTAHDNAYLTWTSYKTYTRTGAPASPNQGGWVNDPTKPVDGNAVTTNNPGGVLVAGPSSAAATAFRNCISGQDMNLKLDYFVLFVV